MTGPVERVPLTDEQIDDMERWALGEGRRILADALADLRASRARAVELPDLNGDLFGDLIAALTGTEAADAGR